MTVESFMMIGSKLIVQLLVLQANSLKGPSLRADSPPPVLEAGSCR